MGNGSCSRVISLCMTSCWLVWAAAAALVLLQLQPLAASPAEKRTRDAGKAAAADESIARVAPIEEDSEKGDLTFLHTTWRWIKVIAKQVKRCFVGESSLFNQIKNKLKENRTITVLGRSVTFSLGDSSTATASETEGSSSSLRWGDSISVMIENLRKEPVLRVLLALYINIVLFIGVYGYIFARQIFLSINLKKAAQPEKEREKRRRKEEKKEAKQLAREWRKKKGNFAVESPPWLADTQQSPGIELNEVLHHGRDAIIRDPWSIDLSPENMVITPRPRTALLTDGLPYDDDTITFDSVLLD